MLAYLTMFGAATTHLRRPDQVKRVLGSVTLTTLPIALYTLVQYPWLGPPGTLGY